MLLPSVAIGFHGCDEKVGEEVLSGKEHLVQSKNSYDWLGWGTYFWEGDPHRALSWAKFLQKTPSASPAEIKNPCVVGAIIQLGSCLDLTHTSHLTIVSESYNKFKEAVEMAGDSMPENQAVSNSDMDLVQRKLDCAVFNFLHGIRIEEKATSFDTVRASFPEGKPLYPGAKITERSHTQICVREEKCILGYFRPIMNRYEGS